MATHTVCDRCEKRKPLAFTLSDWPWLQVNDGRGSRDYCSVRCTILALGGITPDPDDAELVEVAGTARIRVDTGYGYYEGPIGPDVARAVLAALATMGGERA